ncbi:uncharacterized protein LOC135170631 isoform X2 [Diachasmimorpha longicaudata]|uniref:uncharacterized protein LOC135170631 isoform X2 n=1 Tax=Diachasmimorpha longicaudata TaxID=58733 RepID=UPI0030B8E5BB
MECEVKIHELEWNRDMHYALGFSKLWCRTIGVWPWQRNEPASIVRFGVFFGIEAAAVISLVEELFVYGNCGSLADLIEGLSALFIFMITALKVLLPWLQQGQMRSIIQSAMEDWANVCEPRARQIMDQYALLGRLIYIIQISATFVGCIDLIILRPPTLSTDRASNISSARTLIFGPSCWAPNSMPRSLYLFHYHLISMCLCSTIIIYPGWNSFMASAALHLCGQFEVLNASLEERPDDQNDVDQKRRIKKFSIRHDKLLTLGNQLNETVDLIAISEVLSNGFLICLSGTFEGDIP